MARFWKKINSTPYVLLFCAILIFFLFLLGRQFKTKHSIDKEIADLQKQADSLQKNNNELQSFISYFQTDSYKEKVAREQLSVKKPGETVYSFSEQQANITAGNGSSSEDASQLPEASGRASSNALKWWQYFFNKK